MVEWVELGVLGWCLHLCKARGYETFVRSGNEVKGKKLYIVRCLVFWAFDPFELA